MTDALNAIAPKSDLNDLAAAIRAEIEKSQAAWSNALDHAMGAGDALIKVQPKVKECGLNWKKWLRQNCFVAVSTAELYMQLARARDRIEAERQRNYKLSLRAAKRLISASSARKERGMKQEETLQVHWKRATANDRTAFLDAIGVAAILQSMSDDFGRDLRSRVPTPKSKQNNDPKNRKKSTLSLTKTTDSSGKTVFA